VKTTLSAVLLAAAVAACAGGTPSPVDVRPEQQRALPPGEGAFGNAFTWEWRKKDAPPAASAAPAAVPPVSATPAATGKPEDAAKERQEFEEWRAWQEWKRKNQK
jgi:hypothetical protein